VSLVLDDNPDLAVLTDDVLLRRVLGNLTNNALKFTPRGGTIRLKLWQEGTLAHLSIADTGIGVASRMIIGTLDEQVGPFSVPVLHGLQRRSGFQG
jgi:signal transduction histidine kinase